ncbi:MAG: hypothetical protein R3E87_15055 [Burkholderiaceae bacterium]
MMAAINNLVAGIVITVLGLIAVAVFCALMALVFMLPFGLIGAGVGAFWWALKYVGGVL